MKHFIHLDNDPYNKIANGTKTIEMRIYDEKRRKMKVGDIIEIENRETSQTINVEITNIFLLNSFEELYKKFNKVNLGYEKDEIANPKDMEKYYNKEDIEKYGVIAIEIKLLGNNKLKNYIKPIKIGNIQVKNNVFLAPMAGVTDIPFRKICRKFGPGLTFTEMASTKALEYKSIKTDKILQIMEDERPSVVQIFGNDKDVIKHTIEMLNEDDSIDIIDINMGCPAPKLVKNGDGAGLLLNLDKVEEIIREATSVSKKPITVKTRKGFNDDIITAVKVAKICEKYGVAMITIHGRTREQYYTGTADLDIIKAVKEAVSIPVIGNGDITDVNSALKMFEYTGCDGIMIARGAQGNPWIFKSILECKDYVPDNKERLEIILEHIDYALENESNKKNAILKMRKHIAWYLKGIKNSTAIKEKINRLDDVNEVKKTLIEFLGE